MAQRIQDINPNCILHLIPEKYEAANRDQFFRLPYDYIVDAIDLVSCKLDLIETARSRSIPILSSMGTGNKLDPSQFRVADLSQTQGCPLARVLRKELRKRGSSTTRWCFPRAPRPHHPGGGTPARPALCPCQRPVGSSRGGLSAGRRCHTRSHCRIKWPFSGKLCRRRAFALKRSTSWDSRRHGRRRSGNRQRILRRWGRDVLVPLLMSRCALDRRHAFASSVAIIFPLCALSAIIYYTRGHLDLMGGTPLPGRRTHRRAHRRKKSLKKSPWYG